jgi:hypothetical protein
VIYKSHCSCTGNEQFSVFIPNQICTSHQSESCCVESVSSCCSEKEKETSVAHSDDCDCDKPEVTYVKLTDKVVNEEVKFTVVNSVQLVVVYFAVQFNLWETEESFCFKTPYIDPPPIFDSSLAFLIHIQQLKISCIA